MKWFYIIAALILLRSCSTDSTNNCGFVGIWLCCEPTSSCTDYVNGQLITRTMTFEDDGDLFISDFIPEYYKWKTSGDCTELVFDPDSEDETKLKIDLNGDELVVHYGAFAGDLTFCRQ